MPLATPASCRSIAIPLRIQPSRRGGGRLNNGHTFAIAAESELRPSWHVSAAPRRRQAPSAVPRGASAAGKRLPCAVSCWFNDSSRRSGQSPRWLISQLSTIYIAESAKMPKRHRKSLKPSKPSVKSSTPRPFSCRLTVMEEYKLPDTGRGRAETTAQTKPHKLPAALLACRRRHRQPTPPRTRHPRCQPSKSHTRWCVFVFVPLLEQTKPCQLRRFTSHVAHRQAWRQWLAPMAPAARPASPDCVAAEPDIIY